MIILLPLKPEAQKKKDLTELILGASRLRIFRLSAGLLVISGHLSRKDVTFSVRRNWFQHSRANRARP